MSKLVLEKLPGDEFKLVEGEETDFAIIQKWFKFYEDHTTKKQLSVEETKELAELISSAVDGTEHGVLDYNSWKKDCAKLQQFMAERGYRIWGRAFE
jgi:hypothetical protein